MTKAKKSFGRYWRPGRKQVRSGLEKRIKEDLEKRGVNYGYESIKLHYEKERCKHCGEVISTGVYTPDFIINRKSGIRLVVESKGRFTAQDRKKMQYVSRDNRNEDIRIVLQRDQPIRKGSKTLYSTWCLKNGFKYFVGEYIPQEWIEE